MTRYFAQHRTSARAWLCYCVFLALIIISTIALSSLRQAFTISIRRAENSPDRPQNIFSPTPAGPDTEDVGPAAEIAGSYAAPSADTRSLYQYTPPEGETPKKRFPQAVIIGYNKCGTAAMRTFLKMHPHVVVAQGHEIHFYDQFFEFGYQWYLKQMPLSYSDQTTIEKTPAYVRTPRALTEMRRKFPDIKLIVLVRNPVVKFLSTDAQWSLNGRNLSVLDRLLDSNGKVNSYSAAVRQGVYYETIRPWLKAFPTDQLLIVSGEELIQDPLTVIKEVESFLKLKNLFSERNVFFNETKGFFCPVGFGPDAEPRCLLEGKGRTHRTLPEKYLRMLYDFYEPYNEKFFALIGKRFNWPKPQK